jgi:hypothetical protein
MCGESDKKHQCERKPCRRGRNRRYHRERLAIREEREKLQACLSERSELLEASRIVAMKSKARTAIGASKRYWYWNKLATHILRVRCIMFWSKGRESNVERRRCQWGHYQWLLLNELANIWKCDVLMSRSEWVKKRWRINEANQSVKKRNYSEQANVKLETWWNKIKANSDWCPILTLAYCRRDSRVRTCASGWNLAEVSCSIEIKWPSWYSRNYAGRP